ncbi:MAG: hypothetical protein ACTSWE_01260 [Promethearchaeota archaeon]
MNFSSILTKEIKEIRGFTKEQILSVKENLSKLKKETTEEAKNSLREYLLELFPFELLELISGHVSELEVFVQEFLIKASKSSSTNGYHYAFLKLNIKEDIERLKDNIITFKINCRNVLRFLKTNELIEEKVKFMESSLEQLERIERFLGEKVIQTRIIQEKYSWIWLNINKLKDFNVQIIQDFNMLTNWVFYKELHEFLTKNGEKKYKRGKKKKEKKGVTWNKSFRQILDFLKSKGFQDERLVADLLFLLQENHFIEIVSSELDIMPSVSEKKVNVSNQILSFIEPHIKEQIIKEGQVVLRVLGNNSEEEFKKKLKKFSQELNGLTNPEISAIELLAHFLSTSFELLEKEYQTLIEETSELNNYEEIIQQYTSNLDTLQAFLKNISESLLIIEPLLRPHEAILIPLKKTVFNLKEDILRRKEDFSNYVKLIKNEKLRAEIKEFTKNKIEEINELTTVFQEKIFSIINKEFPELQKIRELLTNQAKKIKKIKTEIHDILQQYKSEDIDLFTIIKQWEQNFSSKKTQQSFLLSVFMTKLLKDFKGFLEEESSIFNELMEIRREEKISGEEVLPLNYTMNELLERFTDDELRDRLVEIQAKINALNKKMLLYQQEHDKIEKILTERVKIKEGILKTGVKCGVCRKEINFARDKIIKCPFCGAVYHYLCVAFWLSKYNSCPSCQNKFLDPTSNLFEPS